MQNYGKRFELRRVTYSARLSEETNAYAADLYVDGVLFCHVKNDGHGGSDMQHPAKGKTYQDVRDLSDWIKANHPAEPLDMGGGETKMIEADLESVCSALLTEWMLTKELRRLLNKFPFITTNGELRSFKLTKTPTTEQKTALRAKVNHNYPGAIILADLPFDQAMEKYRKIAA